MGLSLWESMEQLMNTEIGFNVNKWRIKWRKGVVKQRKAPA